MWQAQVIAHVMAGDMLDEAAVQQSERHDKHGAHAQNWQAEVERQVPQLQKLQHMPVRVELGRAVADWANVDAEHMAVGHKHGQHRGATVCLAANGADAHLEGRASRRPWCKAAAVREEVGHPVKKGNAQAAEMRGEA